VDIVNLADIPEHLPRLAAWHHHQWSHLNPESTLRRRVEKMRTHLENRLIPSTFVAMDDAPLGSASIVEHDMDTRTDLSPWLASVFVAPEHRCKGVGSELVRHVMDRARRNGIRTLYLFTPDRAPFYAKLGWRKVSDEDYHGRRVTVMEIELT
jgi:predicted N-acetyltransferase YhbS